MNITNITIANFTDLFSVVNEEVNGIFGMGMLLLFFIVGFIYLNKKYNIPASLFISLVLCLPITSVLALLNLIPNSVFFLYILLISVVGVFMFTKKGKE